ncbi:MAG TPA: glucose 1-dehydrogenase [Terriglobia bacterium]|nr:glucose 1-dehydrogenase [Terriglobia bacterium]
MSEFEGKVAMITGGGSGIGRATAILFAAQGAQTVVIDWNESTAEETVKSIEQRGGQSFYIRADVSRSEDMKGAVDIAVARYGRIDILFASAATQITKSVAETSEEEWERLHDVNLKGTFLCCKYVLPVMQTQKSGSIVIASSGHAFVTYPNSSAYAATKGGLLAFMRGVALDYAADGVRVNCVIPGATDTSLLRNYLNACADPRAEEDRITRRIPLGRLAQPEDIAKAVRFLCSADATYITGTWLAVDGGLLAGG